MIWMLELSMRPELSHRNRSAGTSNAAAKALVNRRAQNLVNDRFQADYRAFRYEIDLMKAVSDVAERCV
jgi:hypothetical protein